MHCAGGFHAEVDKDPTMTGNAGSGGSAKARVTAVLTALATVMLIAVIFGGGGGQHSPIDATDMWLIPGQDKGAQPLKFWTIGQIIEYLADQGLTVRNSDRIAHQTLHKVPDAPSYTHPLMHPVTHTP